MEMTKVFNDIFQFAVNVNERSKDCWHPETKTCIDVYFFGAEKNLPTWMQVDVYSVGKATTKWPTAKFILSSKKPYAEMMEGISEGKKPKEIKIESVINEIKKIIGEIEEEED